MSWFRTITVVAASVVTGLLTAGCQNTSQAQAPSKQGVTCSKCQITYVQVPATDGKMRVTGYRTQKSHECPDCKGAVENFFATGKLEHTCKTCGDSLSVCEAH